LGTERGAGTEGDAQREGEQRRDARDHRRNLGRAERRVLAFAVGDAQRDANRRPEAAASPGCVTGLDPAPAEAYPARMAALAVGGILVGGRLARRRAS
jgi:hypothetical protein